MGARNLPFDGRNIYPKGSTGQKALQILEDDWANGADPKSIENQLNVGMKNGLWDIEEIANIPVGNSSVVPTRKKPLSQAAKKKAAAKVNKNGNPLAGKGKSYGRHVEDGWGQHVRPQYDSNTYDDNWLHPDDMF